MRKFLSKVFWPVVFLGLAIGMAIKGDYTIAMLILIVMMLHIIEDRIKENKKKIEEMTRAVIHLMKGVTYTVEFMKAIHEVVKDEKALDDEVKQEFKDNG